jgi:hypothetical protein
MYNVRDSEKEHVLSQDDRWKKKILTHRFLGKCDGRWSEALPAPLVDESLLLLARFLVYDSSNGGHWVRLETEIPNHDRRRRNIKSVYCGGLGATYL